MADFTKTIENSITCLGGKQTQLWGSVSVYPMVWGVSLWGLTHVFTQFNFFATIDNDLACDSDVNSKDIFHTYDCPVDFTIEAASETMQDSRGYYYNFVRPSTEAEDRTNASYTTQTANTPTYTSLTVSVTTWS